jgi:hypothetical protein
MEDLSTIALIATIVSGIAAAVWIIDRFSAKRQSDETDKAP